MKSSVTIRIAALAVGASTALGAFGQNSEPIDISLPAGMACKFPLRILGTEVDAREIRATTGKGFVIYTGRFGSLQYINVTTGASITLSGKGANSRTLEQPDGSIDQILTGHWAISWFPADNPAGPSTIQYTGRLVLRHVPVGDTYVSTLVSQQGKQVVDICAALS